MKGLNGQIKDMVFTRTKILLGRLLVDGGFISPDHLEQALERQKCTNEMLGEILIGMGVLSRVELEAVLAMQKVLSSPKDAMKVAAGVRQLLGELLIQAQKITHQQLDLALQEQERTGEKLGSIFIRRGILTETELSNLLEFQQCQGREIPITGPLRLGELLVATDQITRGQLEDALQRQRLSKKKIGIVLLEAGYIQPWQVEFGLRLQSRLVTAVLMGMLYLSTAPAVQASSSNRVTVIARVEARTALKVLQQRTEMVITQADVARGYVEVQGATRIEVRNNNPAGYFLSFDGLGGPFKEVYVQGLGAAVQLAPHGGFIPQPFTRSAVVKELSYRFFLTDHAEPGTYSWPLQISAHPR